MGWCFPSGSLLKLPNDSISIGAIFNILWHGVTDHIIQSTFARENKAWSNADINLYLASLLVMGLTPSPNIWVLN